MMTVLPQNWQTVVAEPSSSTLNDAPHDGQAKTLILGIGFLGSALALLPFQVVGSE
jgi:hypothetical protein